MIGYNIQQIEKLITDLNNTYYKVEESISNGWTNISLVMESEWVGLDEVSYETYLAKELCEFYDDCFFNFNNIINNIIILANNWIEFNANSYIESEYNIAKPKGNKMFGRSQLKKNNIRNIVKAGNPIFRENTNMGLMHGIDSSKKIKTAFEVYMNDILKKIEVLNKSFDCSQSFLDKKTGILLNRYLKNINKALVKVSNSQITLDESLDKLINKYKLNEDNQVKDLNKLNNDNIIFSNENIK